MERLISIASQLEQAVSGVDGRVAQNLIEESRKDTSHAGARANACCAHHVMPVYSQIPDAQSGPLGKHGANPLIQSTSFVRGAPCQGTRDSYGRRQVGRADLRRRQSQ